MTLRDRPRSIWAFPLLALAIALTALASDWAGLASGLRGALFDGFQRAQPRAYEDTRPIAGYAVRVLDIDRASLARFGPWPWPHAVLARLIGELAARGAQLVVLDASLDRPDPASPANLAAEIPPGPAYDAARAALLEMPSPDRALADAFGRVATVTPLSLNRTAERAYPVKSTVSYIGARDPFETAPAFSGFTAPIPLLARASAGLGARNLIVDADGGLRRMPMVFRVGGVEIASLDAEALRLAENKPAAIFRAGAAEEGIFARPGVEAVETFRREAPASPDGSIWLAYAGAQAAREVSADALDRGALPPNSLKGAIVYVGAPDDLVATPLGLRSIAEVHAEAMENLLTGASLRRPAAADLAELFCLAACALLAIFLLLRFGVWQAGLFVLAAIAAAGAASWRLFEVNRVLFDALGPSVGLACVFAAGAVARILEVGHARARLHGAFADSLGAEAIERIARKPQLLRLDGENRTVTYMVCGVRGFAAMAESFRDDPVSFMRLLQRVHTPLLDEAIAHRGTVERVSAEGFSAFWNAPLDDPEHAIHACEAASGMMDAIARVNDIIAHERRSDGRAFQPIEIGVGISTGPAVTGGFHSHGRTTYAAAGECSALAERIQALSGGYGPAVIVGEETRKSAERGFAFLEVDYVAVAAGVAPVKLYAVLGNPVMRASPKFRALATFHDHIFQSMRTQQWAKARDLIEQCRKLSGASQKLYDLHLARIDWFERHPPAADWDGAFRAVLN
ncbi:MAG TPA: adenylate/guanylate cyclase domain-containing protein [Rhizomicrobium sp.]|jgi:adenylate cyclase|nr:adenylate/guanylate cyclase domain-containing protein [Rhizomicrobium sp.]